MLSSDRASAGCAKTMSEPNVRRRMAPGLTGRDLPVRSCERLAPFPIGRVLSYEALAKLIAGPVCGVAARSKAQRTFGYASLACAVHPGLLMTFCKSLLFEKVF